jgi:hypothetical protein
VTTALDNPPTTVASSANRRWLALGALALAVLAVGVDGTVLSVALPTLSLLVSAGIGLVGVALTVVFLPQANAKMPLKPGMDMEGEVVRKRRATSGQAA